MTSRNPTDPSQLDPDVVEFAKREGDEEGLVTDIASFFEVDYVSPRAPSVELGRRALERASERRLTPPLLLRR
jgi:hypothetical protein